MERKNERIYWMRVTEWVSGVKFDTAIHNSRIIFAGALCQCAWITIMRTCIIAYDNIKIIIEIEKSLFREWHISEVGARTSIIYLSIHPSPCHVKILYFLCACHTITTRKKKKKQKTKTMAVRNGLVSGGQFNSISVCDDANHCASVATRTFNTATTLI